ncbi:hypothetical protein CTI12_AA072350 [Artemisia annua]|uniref:Uncharacterized protein n=1 Tax=Artemisia annua TaxID=35608 RepID=A0A2U1Q5N8_ARTAN|nr:hypothetical protein CTI12_AA072350 [Artemisia annua]
MEGPYMDIMEELANAADSHLISKQVYVLFHRETLEAEQAVVDLEMRCAQAAEKICKKKSYITEFNAVNGNVAANAVTYLNEMVRVEDEQEANLKRMLLVAQRAACQARRYMAKVYNQMVE